MNESDVGLSEQEIDELLSGEQGEQVERGDFDQQALDRIESTDRDLLTPMPTVLGKALERDLTISSTSLFPTSADEIGRMLGKLDFTLKVELEDETSQTHFFSIEHEEAVDLAEALSEEDAETPSQELSEIAEAHLTDIFTRIANRFCTGMNSLLGTDYDVDSVAPLPAPENSIRESGEEEFFYATYVISGDDREWPINHFFPRSYAAQIVQASEREEQARQQQQAQQEQQRAAAAEQSGTPDTGGLESGDIASQVEQKAAQGAQGGGPDVKQAQFSELSAGGQPGESRNIEMLMDVPMEITVELGRTEVPIQQILNYGQGSLITLDKLAGEPVDLLVNGKYFAKGEVVVIDENFGVRITSILSPEERIKRLG